MLSPMSNERILILGACGQIGTELSVALRQKHGAEQVIAADIIEPAKIQGEYTYVQINVLDKEKLAAVVKQYGVTQIYHLAAILSASGEKDPKHAWDVNMDGLFNVLDVAREQQVGKTFWPSSIAVFGKRTPKRHTPQITVTDPQTVYGISKLAGERWCHYYHHNYGLDVRSLRYPGLISYTSKPGGGTTDYAVEIFYEAIENGSYTCFLKEDQSLPMMYMPDAIRATIELMDAPAQNLRIHSSYNVDGMSFSPGKLAKAIRRHLPDFGINYAPDFRQKIAQAWPDSIDDNYARVDWQWEHQYDIDSMTDDMIKHIRQKLVKH